MISPLTPLDFLARSALVYPEATAVVDGDRRFTYAEFQGRVDRLTAALDDLGVGPGDRVAVLGLNSAMTLEAHFAPMRIGAILVMLNTRLQSRELDWILRHCGAKVLLVDRQLRAVVESAPVERIIDDYEGLLAGSAAAARPRISPLDENACISINYTSGTTG
jgi:fatty-acyl-CoA synthase